MSIASHRGSLPLLNVTEGKRPNWRRHQLSAFEQSGWHTRMLA